MINDLAAASAEAAAAESTDQSAGNSAEADGRQSNNGDAAEQSPASPTSLTDILASGNDQQIREAMRQLEAGGGAEVPGDDAADDGTQEETDTQEIQGTESIPTAEAGEEDDAPKGSPRRIQIHRFPAKDQALLIAAQDLVRENKGLSLADALAEVGFEFKAKAAEAAKAADPAPESTPGNPLAEATAKVAELKQAKAQAKARFDFDEENRIEDELDAAKQSLLELTMEAKASSAKAATERQALEDAEFSRLANVVPDYTTPGTPLNTAANRMVAELEATAPAFFQKATWPQTLLAMAWAEAHPEKPMPALKGVVSKAPAASAKAQPARAVPSKQGTRVAMLGTGNGADDGGNLLNRALRSDAATDDIRKALRALT